MLRTVAHAARLPAYRYKIGTREVVGPSITGVDEYFDRVDVPCPPIRYREPTAESQALVAKEKGDWRSMSIEEKKKLYRWNFCQTIKEVEAPTAEYRSIFGNFLLLLCVPLLTFMVAKLTIFPPLPESMSDENKKRHVRFYIEGRVDPLDGGISSKWDYEKNQWKEKPYMLMKSK